jgi:hypothetical protein
MAQSTPVLDKTYLANADLSTNQFRAVKFTADDTVGVTAAGQDATGIQQDMPAAAGRGCRVRMLGTSKAVAGAAFAAGALLASDATGRLIVAVAGNYVVGRANQAALAAGDIVEVTVLCAGAKV